MTSVTLFAADGIPTIAPAPAATPIGGRLTPDRVETITEYRAFIELEFVWNRLVEESGIDHPFCNFEFVRTWWETFGKGHQLRVIVVKAGTRVVGIAPLMLSHCWSRGMRVRRLSAIGGSHSLRFDFIVSATAPDGHRAICEAILRHAAGWDELRLQGLTGSQRTLDELTRRFASREWRADVSDVPLEGSAQVSLNGDLNEYFARMRDSIARLDPVGDLRVDVVTADRAVSAAVEDGLRIDPADWGGIRPEARRDREAALVFYRLLARRASARGLVSLVFLTAHGRRVAFAYTLRARNKLYTIRAGYDSCYTPATPEHARAYEVFRQSFQHGVDEFESAGAFNPWKEEHVERAPSLHGFRLVRNSWRARVVATLAGRPRVMKKATLQVKTVLD